MCSLRATLRAATLANRYMGYKVVLIINMNDIIYSKKY